MTMLSEKLISEVGYELIKKSMYTFPEDVTDAFKRAYKEEEGLPRMHFGMLLKNLQLSITSKASVCGDTGFSGFFVKMGNIEIEGGVPKIEQTLTKNVVRCAKEAYIRPCTVHPFTRKNPGTNVGPYFPYFDTIFDPDVDYLEITSFPIGAGSELFGSSYRTLVHADGIAGVKRFVIDNVVERSKTGATCPPDIIGVGIGGTSSLCAKIAKRAAVLRPIGDHHPDEEIAALEKELLAAINATGIGPLGMGGKTTAFDVHVEYSGAHLVGFPVAIAMQCPAARMATARMYDDGRVEYRIRPEWSKWFERE